MSRTLRALRRAGWLLALVALALLVIAARVLVSSRSELREGEARLRAGDVEGARDRLGAAARMDAPGSPWSAAALARLADMATASEERGDQPGALAAWREVRSAILATRGAIPRHGALRRRADGRIAVLAAALESPAVDPSADEAARVRWHAARLAEDDAPSPGWSAAALAGLVGWIACALGLFTRGLDERLRFRATAPAWGVGIALGFLLFAVALSRA